MLGRIATIQRGFVMVNHRTSAALAVLLAGAAVTLVALQVRAGGDKVAFPENFAQGVMYTTVDRADNKQFREFYINRAALDAAKKGDALPSGTVITMVQYKAQLDPQGNPVKGPDGRFVKTADINAYAIMEKRTGWGTEYPDTKRNGEWEYQVFTPDKKVNDKANLDACFTCHKPLANADYLFTIDKIKAAAK
jgi:hypothetical protein